ncbi:putative amino-acid metabolite efflux pump [Marinomonas gallaica]|uniref:Amino-acid metabolite efflux pump n=1 Tax=Marinomonas gallaica TaxID=1806667 RepID=A0A1C3JR71_9GAMM|nr:EamA family transporter [Marinomonas gallaica]SBT17672.1 putative amino-acid metabolite efflux pump [Marinomonas gallaica]SBT19998.1 putative amino-acid metabolite efflux pump [Marinomonas gallaica]
MTRQDSLLLVLLMALWGFNFSVIKLGVNNIDPFLLTALRFSLAVLPLIFFVRRPNVPWRYLMTYGLTFGVGVWGLTTLSVGAGLSGGLASLLLDMSVISSLLVGRYLLKEHVTVSKVLGSLLALLGLGLIIWHQDGTVTPLGLALVLSASVFWSINGLIVKRSGTREVFAFNIWGMAFAPIPLLLLALIVSGPSSVMQSIADINGSVLFSAAFQAYPTTLLGYWFWNKMIVKYSVSSVAPMTLLVPVFALIGGYLFFGESLDVVQAIAAVVILLGVAVSEIKLPARRTVIAKAG